jgi:lactose/L-arabinose transport system ATP-binding protein
VDLSGTSHTVEITEALGGVSFVHLTGPTGEKLVVEARGDTVVASGTKVGLKFEAAQVLAFDTLSGNRLR